MSQIFPSKQELWKLSKTTLSEHFALHPKPKFSYENEVYFDKNYGALYGEVFEFSYQKGGLKFKTLGIKQSIANTEFFDIQSPYGYSGFYANTSDEHFLNEALNALKQRASEEKIIAFFLRLHPFDENLAFYQKNLEFFAADRKIILVRTDRALSEIRSDYSPRIKSYVKKARGELDISVADRECAREFHALYAATMQRNNAGEFYFFSQNYFERLFDFADYTLLKASYNGRTLAYASFFLGENFGYYHLSANLNEKNANAALLDYFFELCSERKISFALLGGGLKDEDSLFYFKQRFSTLHTDFNIGGIVFDKAAYSALCEGLNLKQFLAYRFAENGGGGEPHKS